MAFPPNINRSTLIYGMPIDRPQEIEQILQIVKVQGCVLQDAQSLVKGNHWYTGNSMGLFILPEGLSPDQLASAQDRWWMHNCQAR